MILIKKYRNYKYYDTSKKLYISLQEIAEDYPCFDNLKFVLHDGNVDISNKVIPKIQRIRDGLENDNIHSQG
jgi:polyhydroxyalkanoate synthesis regulator protein